MTFAEYDIDRSGYIEPAEMRDGWDDSSFTQWDSIGDGSLDSNEFGSGLYNAADADRDQVITFEEEGWFECWFDGEDVDAELRDVGNDI